MSGEKPYLCYMKRILVLIVVVAYCVTSGFCWDFQLPKEDHVKCHNMSQQQIMDYLTALVTDSLMAETASRDSTLLLAYIERRPQNCVAVIYTIKFTIEKEEFSYVVYYGVTAHDNTDECQEDVHAELKDVERHLRRLLRI